MGKRDSILQQPVPILGQQTRQEFAIVVFTDGVFPVYACRGFLGNRDMGLICDAAQAPLQSASADLLRAYLGAAGWAERVPLTPVS